MLPVVRKGQMQFIRKMWGMFQNSSPKDIQCLQVLLMSLSEMCINFYTKKSFIKVALKGSNCRSQKRLTDQHIFAIIQLMELKHICLQKSDFFPFLIYVNKFQIVIWKYEIHWNCIGN